MLSDWRSSCNDSVYILYPIINKISEITIEAIIPLYPYSDKMLTNEPMTPTITLKPTRKNEIFLFIDLLGS